MPLGQMKGGKIFAGQQEEDILFSNLLMSSHTVFIKFFKVYTSTAWQWVKYLYVYCI